MSLELAIEVDRAKISTLEGLKVEVLLTNRGKADLLIPGPEDESGALGFAVYREQSDALICRMDGLSHQTMLLSARADDHRELDVLPAGEGWCWDVDLVTYHYPLSDGRYEIEAVFDYGGGKRIRSPRQRVDVGYRNLRAISVLRDNPVLEGLTSVFETRDDGYSEFFLRLQSPDIPLAAWYSERIVARPHIDELFCAQASTFQTDTFDHFAHRWVVWREGPVLFAHRFDQGQAQPNTLRLACIPPGLQLLNSAHYNSNDELFVFFMGADGMLRCGNFESRGLRETFVCPLPAAIGQNLTIGADEDAVYIAWAGSGLSLAKIRPDGLLVGGGKVFHTRLPCHRSWFDSAEGAFKAIFWDGPHGKTVELLQFDLGDWRAESFRIDQIRLRGELSELAFDRGPSGRFDLLVSTRRGQLYYYRHGRGPWRVAEGEDSFFPQVISQPHTHLGYYRKGNGFRFHRFDSAPHRVNIR